MKKNELGEIKKQDLKGLASKLKSLRSELLDLTMQKSLSKLTNLGQIKNKRKEIAQVLTVIRQKELLSKLEEQQNA